VAIERGTYPVPQLSNQLKQRPQIFVSYASADSAAAKAIVEGLRSRDLNVWLDADELCPGDRWAESIRAAISASAYFLLLLSKRFSCRFGDKRS
jgi:hypothetical protein